MIFRLSSPLSHLAEGEEFSKILLGEGGFRGIEKAETIPLCPPSEEGGFFEQPQ